MEDWYALAIFHVSEAQAGVRIYLQELQGGLFTDSASQPEHRQQCWHLLCNQQLHAHAQHLHRQQGLLLKVCLSRPISDCGSGVM